jgi:invasion protein IalB
MRRPLPMSERQRRLVVLRASFFLTGALAALAIVVLYLVLGAPAPAEMLAVVQGKPRIAPGFVGVANFGQWRLICVPGPPDLEGLEPTASRVAPDTPKTATRSSCRINQEMPAPEQNTTTPSAPATPRQVIVAANFSLVGPNRTPAAMLRLPATARRGDVIGLRFEDQAVVNATVRDCTATQCLATGTLSLADWAHLEKAKTLQVAFPVMNRQWVLLNLPVEGLSAAIDALDRAENSSAH